MRTPAFLPLITLLVAFTGATGAAWGQSGRSDSGERRQEPPRDEGSRAEPPRASSLSDAVRRVQRETGGQVLGAERVQFDGRDINRIKVMDDRGRVRYMDDDPQRSRGDRGDKDRSRDDAQRNPPARQRDDNPPRR